MGFNLNAGTVPHGNRNSQARSRAGSSLGPPLFNEASTTTPGSDNCETKEEKRLPIGSQPDERQEREQARPQKREFCNFPETGVTHQPTP